MPKHTFQETTTVNNKTFFKGEAEISDADLKALEVRENQPVAEVEDESDESSKSSKRRGK